MKRETAATATAQCPVLMIVAAALALATLAPVAMLAS